MITTKRISYWYGKVNQRNVDGVWKTDEDGTSGADIDMLAYCKKFWSSTGSVKKLYSKESITFYERGNKNGHVSTRDVYECVEASSTLTTRRISYWSGKVNQRNVDGVWKTDPDGTSGADIDMLAYCKKWWKDTTNVEKLTTKEALIFRARGNTGEYTSTRDVYACTFTTSSPTRFPSRSPTSVKPKYTRSPTALPTSTPTMLPTALPTVTSACSLAITDYNSCKPGSASNTVDLCGAACTENIGIMKTTCGTATPKVALGQLQGCEAQRKETDIATARGNIKDKMAECSKTRAECTAEAKSDFATAVGDEGDFERERDRSAKDALAAKMQECLTAAGDDGTKRSKCDAEAKTTFENAGGGEDFELAKQSGAEQVAASKMRECMQKAAQDAATTSGVKGAKVVSAEVDKCTIEAKDAYVNSGGEKDFDRAKEGAASKVVAERTEICRKDASTNFDKVGCFEDAKTAFEEAGGKVDDYDVAVLAGAKASVATKLRSCLELAGTDASKTAACSDEAAQVFEDAGGDKDLFVIAKRQGAAETAAAQVEVCTSNEKECYIKSVNAFVKAGGKEADFDVARVGGARAVTAAATKSCHQASLKSCKAAVRADGLVLTVTIKASCKSSAHKDCKEKAKEVFVKAGGAGDTFLVEEQKIARSSFSAKMQACVGTTAVDAANPASEDLKNCESKAMEAYEEAGGDADQFELQQRLGAAEAATELFAACKEDEADTIISCREKAKKIYKQTGGEESGFSFALATGAKNAAVEKKKACVSAKKAGFSELAINADCDANAKEEFANGGGDEKEFDVVFRRGVKSAVAETLAACMAESSDSNDSAKKACRESSKRVATELGLQTTDDEFERMQNDAAREFGASVFEACSKKAAGEIAALVTCKVNAKAEYKKAGGEEARFDEELKRGARELAADSQKSCIKDAALDKTQIDICDVTSKEVFVNAGGQADDFWYATKSGLLSEAVISYGICISKGARVYQEGGSSGAGGAFEGYTPVAAGDTEGCKTAAKAYFVDVLKATEADWSTEDFDNQKDVRKVTTKLVAVPKVDARFEVDGVSIRTLKTKIPAIEAALDAEVGAGTTVSCNMPSEKGTKHYVACRCECKSAADAIELTTRLRTGEFDAAVSNSAQTSRRLGASSRRRKLSTTAAAASLVQSEVAVGTGSNALESTQEPGNSSASNDSGGGGAGAAIGAVVGVLLLAGIAAAVVYRKKQTQSDQAQSGQAAATGTDAISTNPGFQVENPMKDEEGVAPTAEFETGAI
jgi:Zn-finger nucleic acid-binding protein